MDAVIKKAIQDSIQRSSLAADQRAALLRRLPELTDAECREVLGALALLQKAYQDIRQELDTIELLKPLSAEELTPETVTNLSLDQLRLPETITTIREHLRIIGRRKRGMRATEIENALRALSQRYLLEKQHPAIAKSIGELIALAQFYHLAGLSRLQRRNLFQYHLTTLVREEMDVVDMIDDWLLTLFGADGLDEDLEAVVIGIRNNSERIGSVSIDRETQGTVAPTIQNWLIDYDYLYPREKTRGPVESNEYFARRQKTISRMSPDEQALLRELLQTVDKLLFPERHGTVEEHDVLPRKPLAAPADTGPKRLAPVPPAASPAGAGHAGGPATIPRHNIKDVGGDLGGEAKTLEEKLLSQFEGSARVPGRKSVSAESIPLSSVSSGLQLRGKPADERKIEVMKQQLRSMGPGLISQFHNVIAPKGARASKETHIAALLLLAETNKLEDVIRSQGMHDWFTDYLKSMNKPEILEGFRIAQTSPKFMRIFLAWILQDRAGLQEAEAARFGARIVSALRKQGNEKYTQIAYYDEGKGRFTWN